MKKPDRDDAEEGFELTPEEEQELLAAIAECERGGTIPAADMLEQFTRARFTKSPSSP